MKNLLICILVLISITSIGQNKTEELQSIFRVNVLSPGFEVELPISNKSTISANTGVTISGSYLNLSYSNSGILYFIAPFVDMSYKKFYNLNSRMAKGKSISGNSGNYWGIRLLSNFKAIESENIIRKANVDFAFGPTWGIQRSIGNFHMLFDLGSVYYFDVKGNNGFFPLAMQLNIGYNLKKW